VELSQEEDIKYLGLHLDRRLALRKRKQLGITLIKMYWLLKHKSKLSTSNKLHIYRTILRPIWTYGMQLWGTASTSNIEILERFQSKAWHMIVKAPWYVPNTVIRRILQTPAVKDEFSGQCSPSAHPNFLVVNLTAQQQQQAITKTKPNNLSTRFLV
jgi:hypothetical protein